MSNDESESENSKNSQQDSEKADFSNDTYSGTILGHMEEEIKKKMLEDEKNNQILDPRLPAGSGQSRFAAQNVSKIEKLSKFKIQSKIVDFCGNYLEIDKTTIQKTIINHLIFTLHKDSKKFTKSDIYKAMILSIKDRLFETYEDTNLVCEIQKPKILSILTLDCQILPSLKPQLINLDLYNIYNEILNDFDYKLSDFSETISIQSSTSMLDYLTTQSFPARIYGIYYKNIYDCQFNKFILKNEKLQKLWKIKPKQEKIKIGFGGNTVKISENSQWNPEEFIFGKYYDFCYSGYDTFHTNFIRLFKPKSDKSKSLSNMLKTAQKSIEISTFYKNSKLQNNEEKERKLKQEYFFCSCVTQDLLRNINSENYKQNLSKIAIHLMQNCELSLCIIEMLRIFMDELKFSYGASLEYLQNIFSFETNGEILGFKYEVPILQKILPRHLELIYLLNHHFLIQVKSIFASNIEIIQKLSWIEESEPKKVRFSNICLSLCKLRLLPGYIKNETIIKMLELRNKLKNSLEQYTEICYIGEPHRNFILQINPKLSEIITKYLGNSKWKKSFENIRGLEAFTHNEFLISDFSDMKISNKELLNEYLKSYKITQIKPDSILDIIILKSIPEYCRIIMLILYIIHKYDNLKKLSKFDIVKIIPRTFIFCIKSVQSENASKVIRLITKISEKINNDTDILDLIKIILIFPSPDEIEQKILPAADLFESLYATGYMNYEENIIRSIFNCCLIMGNYDGVMQDLSIEVGKGNLFLYGISKEDNENNIKKSIPVESMPENLTNTISSLSKIIEISEFKFVIQEGNKYGMNSDFESFIKSQEEAEECYLNKEEWVKKAILCLARSGKFSMDCIAHDLIENIWYF